MKQYILIAFLFLGNSLQAQVIDDNDPPVEVEIPDSNPDAVIEEVVEIPKSKNSDIDSAYEKAKSNYEKAQKKLEDARQQKMKADNELEAARVELRSAELAVKRNEKINNPMVIERYEPIINPIFEEMSKGNNYGLSTFIEGAEKDGIKNVFSKNVDAEFKSYMKQFKSSKVKKQKGEQFFDNIIIPSMRPTAMDLYTDFISREDGVEVRTYFNTGSSFINFSDDTAATSYANQLMDNFARFIRQKNLESDIQSLEKELDKTMKDAEKNKEDIVKAKKEIQELENKIAEMRNKIGEFDSTVDSMNDKLEISREKLSKVN